MTRVLSLQRLELSDADGPEMNSYASIGCDGNSSLSIECGDDDEEFQTA